MKGGGTGQEAEYEWVREFMQELRNEGNEQRNVVWTKQVSRISLLGG